jgi:hypothetical protein
MGVVARGQLWWSITQPFGEFSYLFLRFFSNHSGPCGGETSEHNHHCSAHNGKRAAGKVFALGMLGLLASASMAEAQTCASYPYTFSNGTTADATQVNSNFASILNCANTSLAPLASPSFTGNVGIGTSTPAGPLDLINPSQSYIETAATPNRIVFRTAEGSMSSPTATQLGDTLGELAFSGYGSTAWLSTGVSIKALAAENFLNSQRGSSLVMSVTPIGTQTLTEALRIDSSGKVGVGTTTPDSLLDVEGTLNDTIAGDTQDLAHIGATLNPPSSTGANFRAFIMSLGYDTASSFTATGSDTPTGGWFENRIINAGDIAAMNSGEFWGLWAGSDASSLGTVSSVDAAKFMAVESFSNSLTSTITKAIGVHVFNSSANTFNLVGQAGVAIDPISSGANNTALLIGQTSIPAGNFAIYDASTSASFFGGSVGIGTATPAQALEVNGMVQVDTFGSATALPVCELAGVLSSCSSSLRYKENVKDAQFGLSEIEQMRPITFKWKGRDENDFGLVAEEVAKINPLFATYRGGKVEGVKYAQLTAVLINAVKQLKAANDNQFTQIAKLSTQNGILAEDVRTLKRRISALENSKVTQTAQK